MKPISGFRYEVLKGGSVRIWYKLLAGYAVILLAMGLVGYASFRGSRGIASDFHRVNKEELPLLISLKDLRMSGTRLVATTMETAYLIDRQGIEGQQGQEAAELEELAEGHRAFGADLKHVLDQMREHEVDAPTMRRINTLGEQLLGSSERFLDAATLRGRDKAVLKAKQLFEESERNFLAGLQAIYDHERTNLDTLEERAFNSLHQTIVINLWVVGSAALVSLVLGLTLSASLSRRLGALDVAARGVASGDLTHRLEASARDEVGDLSRSFNQMVDALNASREDLAVANGYLGNLVSSMMDGLMVVTVSGEIRDANPSCCRNLEYDREELLGRNLQSFFPDPSEGELLLRDMRSEGILVDRELPLVSKGGQEVHFILSSSGLPHRGGEADSFVCLLHNISFRKQEEQRVLNLAYHDQLTGLPNRRLFMDRLDQAIGFASRTKHPLVLFFFDLDRFKDVNDSLGHKAGDHLLQQVAQRIGTIVRKGDTLARLGGDEFVLLSQTIRETGDATVVATRMLEFLGAPFLIEANEVHSGASIGIVIHPADGKEASVLLRNADLAMYAAKKAGRQQFSFFSQEMNQRVQERAAIETGLRQAALANQLDLHFQPVINLGTGRLVGVEALCRWIHPELGLVSPARFISVAEQTGMIRFLGDWVLQTACQRAKAWKEAGLDFRIWVNVSAAQLLKPDFPESVAVNLKEAGLEPARLGLELTESMLMGVERESLVMIKRLKDLGVALAIDDFGTGYSSLSYLRDFDVDKLKIDRSFVTDLHQRPDAMAIVKAIIAMGHSLGLGITGEGIETEGEARYLLGHGCDEGQGYLFARPMALHDFEKFLQQRS